jgi:hypothetical protein
MLQLLALLFCAAVALLCILTLTASRDWFGGTKRAWIARASGAALLCGAASLSWNCWWNWRAASVLLRSEMTISEEEQNREIRDTYLRTGIKPEDVDSMVEWTKKAARELDKLPSKAGIR